MALNDKERLSEMLISDKLIHEENAKVITEMQESNYVMGQELSTLRQAAKNAAQKQLETEKKLKSAQATIHTLKTEN